MLIFLLSNSSQTFKSIENYVGRYDLHLCCIELREFSVELFVPAEACAILLSGSESRHRAVWADTRGNQMKSASCPMPSSEV